MIPLLLFRDYTGNLQMPRREEDPHARFINHQHSNRSATTVYTRTDQGSFQTRSASRRKEARDSLSHEFLWKTARGFSLDFGCLFRSYIPSIYKQQKPPS